MNDESSREDLDLSTVEPSWSDDGQDRTAWDVPTQPASSADDGPQPGTVIAGAFEVVRFLARGGMGQVYVARDLSLGRLVAVKLVRSRGRGPEAQLALFEREARATARLTHPNIVTIHQFGCWGDRPFLVLELLRGESVAELVTRRRLTVQETVAIATDVARALAHAHAAGLVHRDLKMGNVFLTEDGGVKVLDFGLSAFDPRSTGLAEMSDASLSLLSPDDDPLAGAGTLGYTPPEQWRGEIPNARADVFALGVLMFRVLSGDLPYDRKKVLDGDALAPRLSTLNAQVPSVLDQLVARAIEKDPTARFQTATEMLEALQEVDRALATEAGAGGEPYRFLEAFSEADAPWFFGREREAARLAARLERSPLVTVVGPSGAGKSSLVRAGVVPRLRRGSTAWTTVELTPGRQPLRALFDALEPHLVAGEEPVVEDATRLVAAPGLAGQVLRAAARRSQGRVLLLVDQTEELYTQGADRAERDAFGAAVLSAGDVTDSPVAVILTIRGDFVHRLTEQPRLAEMAMRSAFALGVPDRAAMIRAVAGPAERLGFRLEDGLAEAMVQELAAEAAPLPVLQFAASRLWERRDHDSRTLTHAALAELGGVAGVLAGHAEHIYHSLLDAEDAALARRLLCSLVTADGTRRPVERSRMLEDSADADRAAQVLDRLIGGRLLTTVRDPDGDVAVQLAHESLIERWQRLSGWLTDGEADRRLRERLHTVAALWNERGRPQHLQWSGDELDDALRLLDRTAHTAEPIATFVRACAGDASPASPDPTVGPDGAGHRAGCGRDRLLDCHAGVSTARGGRPAQRAAGCGSAAADGGGEPGRARGDAQGAGGAQPSGGAAEGGGHAGDAEPGRDRHVRGARAGGAG